MIMQKSVRFLLEVGKIFLLETFIYFSVGIKDIELEKNEIVIPGGRIKLNGDETTIGMVQAP